MWVEGVEGIGGFMIACGILEFHKNRNEWKVEWLVTNKRMLNRNNGKSNINIHCGQEYVLEFWWHKDYNKQNSYLINLIQRNEQGHTNEYNSPR